MLTPISERNPGHASNFALFNLGFRPFFLGAGLFAIITMSLWAAIYLFGLSLPIQGMNPFQWHAHEMIYGYSMAVVAGFLLTAVKNWTGISPISASLLCLTFMLWMAARLCFIFAPDYILLAACFDFLFSVLLLITVSRPVLLTRQWQQLAVISKLALIQIFNGLFYAGALDVLQDGLFLGIYGGLYLLLGLVLTMGRRVLPFFIERGVGYPLTLFNSKWLDIPSLLLFLGFFVNELFLKLPDFSAYLALLLFLVNAIRLVAWHTPGIWRHCLLWSLYLSFWFITLGFLLFALGHWLGLSPYLAIHAFAMGGIGLVTISMMSRVSLGHTGRQVAQPPRGIAWSFGFLALGTLVRVVLPLLDSGFYTLWIGLAQLFWVTAFIIFVAIYLPILIKPDLD